MSRRVVVHAGFHKTGTTSVQAFLHRNGKHLWPRVALVLPARLRKDVSQHATTYARLGGVERLDDFAADLSRLLRDIDLGEKRALLISDENLCGAMPGAGVTGYGACPDLMERIADVVHAVIDEEADLRFVFTTRDRDAWRQSLWLHNLRHARMRDDFDTFTASLDEMAEFDTVLEAVRARLPHPVIAVPLETVGSDPAGPARAVLDELDLPAPLRARLEPVGVAQRGVHPALAAQLLTLNRSGLDDEVVRARKAALTDDG